MDIDIREIEGRIRAQFAQGHPTLFWEDEPGEYAEVVGSLDLGAGALVDATGAELASKRAILRDRPAENIVVYRSGACPRPEDDFLYDVKLSATPFTCKMEGIWASECDVPMGLADTLAEHAKFFNSKERRRALSVSALPKDGERSLRLAMLAACAGSGAESSRDAVRDTLRKMLVELGRGQNKTMRTIVECGLAQTLWSEVSEVVGYTAPDGADPTLEDLAIRMLRARCGGLLPDEARPLKADAMRILADLASNGRTRDSYDALAREYTESITAAVSADKRTMEAVGANDTLPVFDEWVVADMLRRVLGGSLRSSDVREALNRRLHTLWIDDYKCQYEALAAAAGVLEETDAYRVGCTAKTTAKDIFEAYCDDWYRADREYRVYVGAMRCVPARFKRAAEDLTAKVDYSYSKFLDDLTGRWQAHLMDTGAYPPAEIASQADFFRDRIVKAFPRAEAGKRMGVIVSDAMRYEIGADLASRVTGGTLTVGRGRSKATCEAMACMLPSYTQLGMAALLPQGVMEVDPSNANVRKGGEPTSGISNRQKLVEAALPGAVLLQAAAVLEEGLPPVDDAPLVMVYHNAIDKRGDSRDTEGEVFAACEDAVAQVAAIAGQLLRAGCGKVLVTSDHGFLYQDRQVEDHNYAAVDGLSDLGHAPGADLYHNRRFVVGSALPQSDALVAFSAEQLSLAGDEKFAFPLGVTRLRLRGSGARYAHGGASLQEDVVPVVTIERVGARQAAEHTGAQGFLCGRPSITGATVALDVYQTQACSEKVSPLTVKVGLYDPEDSTHLLCAEEPRLELASTAEGSEERKTRVALHVTDDVDDCAAAVLRISKRVGNTNQYDTEWEQRLSVNRAFGNDFDF